MAESNEQETAFEMGQRVHVYDKHDEYIASGEVNGIHVQGDDEFYDVKADEPPFEQYHRVHEVSLADA